MIRNKQLKKIHDAYIKGALEGHKKTLVNMSNQSLKECPLDTGAMRESYKVDINGEDFLKGNKSGNVREVKDIKKVKQDVISSEASYSTKYVIIQHEDLTFNHPEPGTKAKFLEDPVKVARKEYVKNIKEQIKEAIR